MKDVLAVTKDLINRRSVTPEDAGCQDMMKDWLAELGFNNETMPKVEFVRVWDMGWTRFIRTEIQK